MSGVNRVEELIIIDRLNELEAIVPVYRAALEHIADVAPDKWSKVASDALKTPTNWRPHYVEP
jgi:hypothetical protein